MVYRMTLREGGGSLGPGPQQGAAQGSAQVSAQESAHGSKQDVAPEFAKRLRALRASASSPTFRSMAKATHYSHSALAEATSGRRLPTEAVVRAFATACGADADAWAADLAAVHAETTTASSAEPDRHIESATPEEQAEKTRRKALILRAAEVVGTLVVGGAIGAVCAVSASGGTTSVDPARPIASLPTMLPSLAASALAMDGSDPVSAQCVKDATLVDKVPVMQNATQVGALEIKYSRRCSAAWGRAYLYDGQPRGFADVSLRTGDGRSVSFADLVTTVPVYTDVLSVRPGSCIQAAVDVLLGTGSTITAQTPCETP
jgi:transcriptional regulator with XRE-family HTH domain